MKDHKSKVYKQTYSTRLSVWDFNLEGKRKIDHNHFSHTTETGNVLF